MVDTPHRESGEPNMPEGHKVSDMAPNGGRPCDGSSPPARNTLVVFLRFFHLARRFWNHTCAHMKNTHKSHVEKKNDFESTLFLRASVAETNKGLFSLVRQSTRPLY